jgi:CheY-like chemotaxis protein
VLRRLRADAATAAIPVVVLSADATPGQARQLREEGAADYLTKPLDIDLLLNAITRAIESRARGPRAPSLGR